MAIEHNRIEKYLNGIADEVNDINTILAQSNESILTSLKA